MATSQADLEYTQQSCPVCDQAVDAVSPWSEHSCPHCGQPRWLVRKHAGDVVVLTVLAGLECSAGSIARSQAVCSAVKGASRVLINLSHLRTISPLFLTTLLTIRRRLQAVDGAVKICGVQPAAAEIFRFTQLDRLFDIYADEKAAVDSF